MTEEIVRLLGFAGSCVELARYEYRGNCHGLVEVQLRAARDALREAVERLEEA